MSIAAVDLHHVFGFQGQVNQGIAFHDDKTLLYLSGQMCVFHNIDQGHQKFLHCPELNYATALARTQKYLAIADKDKEKPSVSMYSLKDFESGSKRKILPNPESHIKEYICLAFSPDGHYLAAQSGPPDWTLVLWLWEKRTIETTFNPSNLQSDSKIYKILFHSRESDQIVAIGKNFFRLYKFEENTFKQHVFMKYEQQGSFLSVTWLPKGRLAVGTSDAKILMFDGIEQKYEIVVSDLAARGILSTTTIETEGLSEVSSEVSFNHQQQPITCLVTTSKGLVCTFGHTIAVVYERTEDNKQYKYRKSFYLPIKETIQKDIGEQMEEGQKITHMVLSPDNEVIAASTDYGQLFRLSLLSEVDKTGKLEFEYLAQVFHNKPIWGLDISVRKPLMVTSTDHTVILWDYEKYTQELRKRFYDQVLSVALHPLGLFLLIGFPEYLRLFTILMHDLREVTLFNTRGCHECSFSNGGHLMAGTNQHIIEIYCVVTFKCIAKFKGHQGKITALIWRQDDTKLVSCDTKGAVYEWDIFTKSRSSESVLKTCGYYSVTLSPDGQNAYAVGSDLTIKQISDSDIVTEASTKGAKLKAIALSRTGHMLFAGTEKGCIRSLRFPLTDPADFNEKSAHKGSIIKIKIAFGDEFMMSTGADGMLCIWKITDIESRKKEVVPHAQEILIARSDLAQKLVEIRELEQRLVEIKMDNEYKLQLKEMSHTQNMRMTSDEYEKKMDDLNAAINEITLEKNTIISTHEEEVLKMEENHQNVLNQQEHSSREKLLFEFERYDRLKREKVEMEVFYENKIKEMEEAHIRVCQEMTETYEDQLQDRDNQLEKERKKSIEKEQEFTEMWKQIEEGTDMEILDIRSRFERQLWEERSANVKLKEDNAILKKKLASQQRELEDQRIQIKGLLLEQTKLHTSINNIAKDVMEMKREIRDRDNTIQEKEKRIYEFNRKTQELEKYKFVLNYNIDELKKQLEPKDEEIFNLRIKIQELTKDLLESQNARSQMKQKITSLTDKFKAAEKEVKEEKQMVYNLQMVLERYRSELYSCANFIQDPKKLKESVKKLYEKHVRDFKKETTAADLDLNAEFSRQRDHLERSLGVLRKQLHKDNKSHRIEYVRMVQENSELIKSINELRQELKLAHSRIRDMETALGLTSQEYGSDVSETRQKLEKVVASVRRKEDISEEELNKLNNIINTQQQEIGRLQALLIVTDEARIVKSAIPESKQKSSTK